VKTEAAIKADIRKVIRATQDMLQCMMNDSINNLHECISAEGWEFIVFCFQK
jgi:hypothetical protein